MLSKLKLNKRKKNIRNNIIINLISVPVLFFPDIQCSVQYNACFCINSDLRLELLEYFEGSFLNARMDIRLRF